MISLLRDIKSDFVLEASEQNDFSTIKIWTSSQKDFKSWRTFCNQLVRSRISTKFSKSIDPEEILGLSHYDRILSETFRKVTLVSGQDFVKNTPTWHLFRELAKIDLSFKSFLIAKGINPNNPEPLDTDQKDSVFRKIKQLAVYRFQFKKGGNYKRSRKVIPLFYGLPLIYELCDGNPRMLIGVIDELLEIASRKPDGSQKLTINEQSKVMITTSQKYLQVIPSHPDANVTVRNININLSEILETIGDYFHRKIVNESFTMDPNGSFRVDAEIDNKILDLLELAIYLGAVVYLDNEDILSINGLFGKRLRLSYSLSPYFSLLSRDFKETSLSNILLHNRPLRRNKDHVQNQPIQPKLFN